MEDTVTTNVIKRNGEEVHFDRAKIVNAITKANGNVERIHQMNPYQIEAIADTIAEQVQEMPHAVNVEDIQDMVETGIMELRGYEVAQKYVRYRYKRELMRKTNTTDNGILALLDHMNEEVNQENSNKNPVINSTQRDYMAGEVSKDLTMRVLLPEEVQRLVHLSRRVLLQLCCPLPGLALDSPHLTAQHDMGLSVRTQRLHLFL